MIPGMAHQSPLIWNSRTRCRSSSSMDAYSPDDVIDAAVLEAFSSRAVPGSPDHQTRSGPLRRHRCSRRRRHPVSRRPRTARRSPVWPAGTAGCCARSGTATARRGSRSLATSVALAKSILAAASRGAVATRARRTPPASASGTASKHGAKHSERALPIERWTEIRHNYAREHGGHARRAHAHRSRAPRGPARAPVRPAGHRQDDPHPQPRRRVAVVVHAGVRARRRPAARRSRLPHAGPASTRRRRRGRAAKRWRLLVLEDCGEFLRADAKQAIGQGLSRLLNLTDGLLGQGLNLLVLISTNDELARAAPGGHASRPVLRADPGRPAPARGGGAVARPPRRRRPRRRHAGRAVRAAPRPAAAASSRSPATRVSTCSRPSAACETPARAGRTRPRSRRREHRSRP